MQIVHVLRKTDLQVTACDEASGEVRKLQLPFARREFLKGSAVLTGTLVSGTILSALAPAPVWALELKTFGKTEGETLMAMGRVLYPHKKLPDAVYALLAKDLDAKAAGDPATKALLLEGIKALDGAAGGRFTKAATSRKLAAVKQLEGQHFFAMVRGQCVTSLYDNDMAFAVFGYPGSAWEKGGYITRGFQDLKWLPPALTQCRTQIVGGSMTPSDESGDAHLFTQGLARRCAEKGVEFLYDTRIVGVNRNASAIERVRIASAESVVSDVKGDAFALCMGSFSAEFARGLGISLGIYPAKGYSVTLPVLNPSASYTVSLTDDEYKLVFSRFGNRMRIAGTAELNGYDTSLNLARCEAIARLVKALFPGMTDGQGARYWTGLRPATPSNVPCIGRTRLGNFFLNTGHGTLGWTHSAGSGQAITDIVSGRRPQLDFAFTG